jgi:Fic family protein
VSKISGIPKKIIDLRKRYYHAIKDKESLLTLIAEAEISEQVYHSNAIENSTLSLEETEKILLQIDLDRFITEREIFEAKNLARVMTYIQGKAAHEPLTLTRIQWLHKLLLSNIRDDVAGRFRENNEHVRVGSHIAPPPKELHGLLEEMMATFHSSSHQHIVQRIAQFHLMFEYIHPFVDGNGRIGRVLNNYLLLREGFVPINIKVVDRQKYYEALKAFDASGKTKLMEELVGLALTNSYHKRLAYLEEKKIVSLADYAKRTKHSHSNLINKASRQTIEAFFEKNKWKIGI